MEFSLRSLYSSASASTSSWYWLLVKCWCTIAFSTAPGYEKDTLGRLGSHVCTVKFSGKLDGSTHQIPSVSNSSGRLKRERERNQLVKCASSHGIWHTVLTQVVAHGLIQYTGGLWLHTLVAHVSIHTSVAHVLLHWQHCGYTLVARVLI